MRKIILLAVFVALPFASYAHKLTVIYTANSYASLYPCGHCPASVGGGISRRAAVIDEIKNTSKNTIIIDAGNFTAGGPFDEASVNYVTDQKRSLTYYKAMQECGYEVVGLGDSEFNFGLDFLKKNLKDFKFKAVSSNAAIEGIPSYYIKNFPNFKAAVISLTAVSGEKKAGIKIQDYTTALNAILAEVKNKSDFIILLSSAGDETDKLIASKFKDIKLIISSGNTISQQPYEKIDNTIIMKPSYRAKDLRVAFLDVKKNNILSFDFKKRPLSMDVKEDTRVSKMIPACFSDADCPMKPGLVSACQNAGELAAVCAYFEPNKIEAILITDSKCQFCSTEFPQKALTNVFAGIHYRIIDYRDTEAKNLIKKYSIKTLPAFIVGQEVKTEKNFDKSANIFEEKNGTFLLKKELSGLFIFLDRPETSRTMDFFLNFYDETAQDALSKLISFCDKNKIKLEIHFVIEQKNTTGYPEEEMRIAFAIKRAFPAKFPNYLKLRLGDIKNTSYLATIEKAGIDYKKIKGLLKSKEIDKMVEENNKLLKELNVNYGNVLLINNNRIFKVFKIRDEDLKAFFKD
jgi:hypothetical protein